MPTTAGDFTASPPDTDRAVSSITPPPGPAPQFRFSTDDLPERERVVIWREVFGRYLLKIKFEAAPAARFSHSAKA